MEKERQRKFRIKPVFWKRELKEKHSLVVKVGLSRSKKNCFICIKKSPLKKMKNAFYFILKPLVQRKFMYNNGLIRKVNFKIYKIYEYF